MAELKTLVKNKEKESDNKNKRLHFSHENEDPEHICSLHEPKVPTLIRPLLTNPKVFWSTLENAEFSSSSKNFKNSYLEEKVITNFFKPIRSEISSEISNNTSRSKGKKKEAFSGKVDKSIHESLRIQKTKRRTSLPFFWNEDFDQELVPAVEKVQTYDFSYYSSILKRLNQEKTQYYSSTKKNDTEKYFPMKFASDERIYGEKQNDPIGNNGGINSERISVTEPSSPLPIDCFIEVNRKAVSSDSEMDSESTGSDFVLKVKKSKSFVNEKEADGYFKTKSQPKMGTLELSKTSQSSTSSCDSAYKTRSLRVHPKTERKNEVRNSMNFAHNLPKNQSYVYQVNKYWSEISGKDKLTYKKVLNSEDLPRERCQSSNRDTRRDEDLQKMKENVFGHLLEALMQKNHPKIINEKQKELLSKSLPRNTGRWKNDRYQEECLKVLKSVLEQDPMAKNQVKAFDRKYETSKKISQNENLGLDTKKRRKKTAEASSESRGISAQRVAMRNETEKEKNNSVLERIPRKKNSKGKLGTNLNEECVFTIEDKKLWIEICKAVEKVDVKGKIAKKYARSLSLNSAAETVSS